MNKLGKHISDSIGFVFCSILSDFGINRNRKFLKNLILTNHPDYPSYNSLFYCFKKTKINCALITTTLDGILSMPTPFITKLNIDGGKFIIVDKIDELHVEIRVSKNQHLIESMDFFSSFWDKGVLLLDYNSKAEIPISNKGIVIKKINRIVFPTLGFIIFLLHILSIIKDNLNSYGVLNSLYFIVLIFGIIISVLFFIYEVDKNNKLVNQVCRSKSDNNRDCGSILDSKDAYFLNIFKWSDLGFVFFIFLLSLLLFFPMEISIGWISILFIASTVYIPYSLIYQKFIAKKWCTLCLLTQLSLLLGAIISFINIMLYVDFSNLFEFKIIFSISILGIFIISAYSLVKTLIIGYLQRNNMEKGFRSFKITEDIQKAAFAQQKFIKSTPLSAIIINPNRDNVITMIVNTSCNPCMSEISKILPLYFTKEDTTLEIIFFLDRTNKPSVDVACFLLHTYKANKKEFLTQLLNYADNYPASLYRYSKKINTLSLNDKEQALSIIADQEKWCIENNINATPKIFINYHEKPNSYDIIDIDYLCT